MAHLTTVEEDSNRRPTIIDIARLAGVSKSTVGRVLAGASNVSETARKQVLRVSKSLGYEPNSLAVAMRSGHSGMLGLIVPDVANPFWAEVARGAQDRAAQDDISILVFSSDWDPRMEMQHLGALMRSRVEGAIVNPVAGNLGNLDRFAVPFVLLGSSAESFPNTYSIGSDISQAVELGMSHLVSKGHRAPALILGGRPLARDRFLSAVHRYCASQGIDPAILVTEDADYTLEGGRQAMQKLLKSRDRSRHLCVFASNDLMALGAILASREAGLRCPEDVSILGFDGIQAGAVAWPGLTTIEKPARRIGEQAVAALMEDRTSTRAGERVYLPCRLIERGSLADLQNSPPTRSPPTPRKNKR